MREKMKKSLFFEKTVIFLRKRSIISLKKEGTDIYETIQCE